MARKKRDKYVLVSVDPGQSQDPYAVSVVEAYPKRAQETFYGKNRVLERGGMNYRIRLLERHLGNRYTDTVGRTIDVLERACKDADSNTSVILVCDITGPGLPVKDMLVTAWRERSAGTDMFVTPAWISITGGNAVEKHPGYISVPKRELVSATRIAMERGDVHLPRRLPLRKEFLEEMRTFRAKITSNTGHDSYEHWRERDKDDMLLAVADAIFVVERFLKPKTRVLRREPPDEPPDYGVNEQPHHTIPQIPTIGGNGGVYYPRPYAH